MIQPLRNIYLNWRRAIVVTNEAFWGAYNTFSMIILIILGIFALLLLLKSIMGPTVADRIVSVNMMSTVIVAMITVLLVRLREGYLADICLIYALISFLAVIVLCKVYLGAYLARKKKKGEQENGNS